MFFFIPISLPSFDIFSAISALDSSIRAMKDAQRQVEAAKQMAERQEAIAYASFSQAQSKDKAE